MTDNTINFTHLHVHTQYSLLDGAIRLGPLFDRVKEFGMDSVAITDHGTMFGAVEFYEKANKAGIKPIIGCECYVAPKSLKDKTPDGKGTLHLVLLAENQEGYQNLCKLASIAQLEGFYYRPRIDKEVLRKYNKGLIAMSACLHGEIPQALSKGNTELADEAARFYLEVFGENNFFLEVQNNGIPVQEKVNQALLDMSQRLSIPLVATNDCHYLSKEDVRAHDVLLCIQTQKTIHDTDRFKFRTDQLYFKSKEEMFADFQNYPGALDNTADIAKRCNIEFDFNTYHFPKFESDSDLSADDIFDKKVREGFEKRLKYIKAKNPDIDEKIYNERLEYEVSVIKQMGFPGYFLIVADFIQYAKENKVPVGPGRGCVCPDSKVLLANGKNIAIQDVEIGDNVITHMGNVLPVQNKMVYDCDEKIVHIDVANEVLSLTQDHKIWAIQSEKCTVDSPKMKSVVCKPSCTRYCGEKPFENYQLGWIRAGQLQKDDFVVFPRTASESRETLFDVSEFVEHKEHIRFDEEHIWYEIGTNQLQTRKIPRNICFDQDFAKLLGYYISEGWSRLGERECEVGFGFHKKETVYAEEVQELMEKIFNLESKIVFHKTRNGLQVIAYSRIAGEFLTSLCGKGANNKHIPFDIVSNGKDDLLKILIAYLFRGDGCDGKSEKTINIKYSTTSPILASQLRLLLARFGYWGSVRKRIKPKENWADEYSVRLSGRQLLQWNNDFPAFSIPHRDQKFYRNDGFYTDEQYVYLKIKNVRTSDYKGKVYDITVSPDTSYVSNSIAVHNSAAGSIVAYALGITDLDPIEHGLIFERFLNPARISMPDIDVDFCINGREKVYKYVTEKYGGKAGWGTSVAQIITFGKLKTRAVIRDVGRALDIPLRDVDAIAKMVPDVLNISLEGALEQEPKIGALAKERPEIDDLIKICRVLEGLPRHASTHAAGVVIGDKPLADYLPLYKGKKDEVVTQFDMKWVENIGLVKFDFLGLRNLTVIEDTLTLIAQQKKEVPDLLDLDFNDPETYKLLSAGDTTGVFQLESSGMKDLLTRLRPACFDDVTALVALYRPGPLDSGMVDDFVERKHGKKVVEYLIDQLESILKETYGVIVYQEQVMKIASELASYSMAEADGLRKAMGKKIPEIMAQHRDRFVKGATENGILSGKATQLFDLMEKFGGYGFNKSHSAAYALIAYQTAYLKTHYPVEFMASLLTSEMHSIDGVVKYIAECRSHGISVLPPDINESGKEFTVTGSKIRFGLVAVKNVGEGAIELIIEARKEKKFSSLFEFCERVDLQKVNKRVLESLIKCGAFDSTGHNRAQMTAALEDALDYGQRLHKEKNDPQMGLFDMGESTEQINAPSMPNIDEWDEKERLALEKEALGFYITGHPLGSYEELLDKFTNADTLSLKEKSDGQDVRIGGMIKTVKEIRTKKGDPMAFITTEDMHGTVETVVFTLAYEPARELLTSDSAILIEGKVQKDESSVKILADKIVPLDKAEETWTASIHFKLDISKTDRGSLEKLYDIIKKYPGSCLGYLHLSDPGATETTIALPDNLRINADPSLTRETTELFGHNIIETACKAVSTSAQFNEKNRREYPRK
ncbi:MAG: DNA polymerase III subunit alpha [Desulfobacteraceae bacterium]|nr:DNA polymerase III subunit alpha [Desulfobacteraceae bacterium]